MLRETELRNILDKLQTSSSEDGLELGIGASDTSVKLKGGECKNERRGWEDGGSKAYDVCDVIIMRQLTTVNLHCAACAIHCII